VEIGFFMAVLAQHVSCNDDDNVLSPSDLSIRLRRHVDELAQKIGPRSTVKHAALRQAAEYIERALVEAGYPVRRQVFAADGRDVWNIDAELPGRDDPNRIVVIGAHYDTLSNSPGANDNGSGVAAMLELARLHAAASPGVTVRFAAFVNEEPPHFQTETMGSLVYARRCRSRGERVEAMISLETIGYYTIERGSQRYPPPLHLLFPSIGNFLAIVGNFQSRKLVTNTMSAFRQASSLPVVGSPAPETLPGVAWSDHWSFWQQGYPAIMLTDTAPFRYPHYHRAEDTPDKLDYARLARVVEGLQQAILTLAAELPAPAVP
jgi:Zn-dependent M28 family amino/carboxypeptidase